jgi:pimeloyl-ACP methyl ester carboxylesterase
VGGIESFEYRGCRLAYRIDGAGPPLVWIQGVGAHGLSLNPQVEILKTRFACLTFDNRGIGASQPVGMPLSVEQMAADTLALMDHVGWASAHIVGHSLGGLVALRLALMAKARVRSMSLLCSFARGADALRMTLALVWILLRLKFAPRRWRRDAFMELVLPSDRARNYSNELVKRFSDVLGHDVADMPSIVSQQLAALREHEVTPHLRELAGIPTLVISGEKDKIAPPSSGRAIAAGIPGARYVGIPGASHALPILEAERCAALLLDHLTHAAAGAANKP